MGKLNLTGALDEPIKKATEEILKMKKELEGLPNTPKNIVAIDKLLEELPKGIEGIRTPRKELKELGHSFDEDSIKKIWKAYKKETSEAQKSSKN